VEPDETSVDRQRPDKNVSARTTNNESIAERCWFPLGPPWGYIARNPGQLKGLRSPVPELIVRSCQLRELTRVLHGRL
jgi:hypothetical protein